MNELLELRDKLLKSQIAIEQSLGEVERMIEQVEMDALRDAGFTNEYLVVGSWACPTSPVETCVYDDEVDSAWDNCIFCGHPDERK